MSNSSRLSSLTLTAILLFFVACTTPYKHLQQQPKQPSVLKYKPVFDKELYRCVTDGKFLFKKFHLSGLLFFKTLENGTVRAIYQNEMGFTFFDFEWDEQDSFKVNQIIPQLNKPALVKVLKKDMGLLLMKGLDTTKEILYRNRGNELLYCLPIDGGTAYYVEQQNQLIRIENAGKRKTVTTITLNGKKNAREMPQHILFKHHKANFTIELTKIEAHVDE